MTSAKLTARIDEMTVILWIRLLWRDDFAVDLPINFKGWSNLSTGFEVTNKGFVYMCVLSAKAV